MPHLLEDGLDITEILWDRPLNPNISCQLLPGASSLSTVDRLVPLSLPGNNVTWITDRLDMILAIYWAVKRQHNNPNEAYAAYS